MALPRRPVLDNYVFSRAGIAQLIERRLAKAKVAGLSPVSRSIFKYIKSCIKAHLARIISILHVRKLSKSLDVS